MRVGRDLLATVLCASHVAIAVISRPCICLMMRPMAHTVVLQLRTMAFKHGILLCSSARPC